MVLPELPHVKVNAERIKQLWTSLISKPSSTPSPWHHQGVFLGAKIGLHGRHDAGHGDRASEDVARFFDSSTERDNAKAGGEAGGQDLVGV